MICDLDENTKVALRTHLFDLEEDIKRLKKDRDVIEKQIRDQEDKALGIKKTLGISIQQDNSSSLKRIEVVGKEPRPGTVTDEIRILFENSPKISREEVIAHIRDKFPKSKIDYQSFSLWDSYFRKGRYLMNRDAYVERYETEPPY